MAGPNYPSANFTGLWHASIMPRIGKRFFEDPSIKTGSIHICELQINVPLQNTFTPRAPSLPTELEAASPYLFPSFHTPDYPHHSNVRP